MCVPNLLVESHASKKGLRFKLGLVRCIAFGHSETTVMAELQVIPAKGGLMPCCIAISHNTSVTRGEAVQIGKSIPAMSGIWASMRISS